MKPFSAIASVIAVVVSGCTATPREAGPTSVPADRPASEPALLSGPQGAPRQSPGAVGQSPGPVAQSDAVALKAYEVKESAFSDFGMSLRTNLDVTWGGMVEWMRVSAVDPGSSAARIGLRAGDRILAIDGQQVNTLDRDTMLARFFQRKRGEVSELLVMRQKDSLPRFVRLVANRPGV